jgi:hypothetical protein
MRGGAVHAWTLLAWHALEGLAATFAPYAFLAAVLCLLAVGRLVLELASPKSYSNEQRIAALVTASLPAAVQPGSIPPVPETWHDFPAFVNSWGRGTGGWAKYRLLAEGSVEVSMSLRQAGTKTDGAAILPASSLPAAYCPVTARRLLPAVVQGNALSSNWVPDVSFNTDGSLTVFGVNNGASTLSSLDCHGVYSTF